MFRKPVTRPGPVEVQQVLDGLKFTRADFENVRGNRRVGETVLTSENNSGTPLDFYAFEISRVYSSTDVRVMLKGKPNGANLAHFYTSKRQSKTFKEFSRVFPNSNGWFAFYVIHTPIDTEDSIFVGVANIFCTQGDPEPQPGIEVVRSAESQGGGFQVRFHHCLPFGEKK